MISLQEQYRQSLNNWLTAISQTVFAIQNDPNATYEVKLQALDTIQKQLPEAKRALMFLMNTAQK